MKPFCLLNHVLEKKHETYFVQSHKKGSEVESFTFNRLTINNNRYVVVFFLFIFLSILFIYYFFTQNIKLDS